jgi:uncharacterized protein YegL
MGKKNFKEKSNSGRKDLDPTEFVCVIDRSGSMSDIRDDAIGGFNTFLKEQQGMQGAAFLTMVQFDHEYITVYNGEPIENVKPLDHKSYVPRGMTSLYDAIGRAITTVRERYEKPGADPSRIMVVILTDGQENNSHEYNRAQITDMIKNCTDTLKWAFLYLSASTDAFIDGSCIGLGSGRTIGFTHTQAGGQTAGVAYSMAAQDFRNTGSVASASVYATRADPSGKHLRTQTFEQ